MTESVDGQKKQSVLYELENAGLVWLSSVEWYPNFDRTGWICRGRNERYYDPRHRGASISVLDHGLLYGGGIFEGINFYYGKNPASSQTLDVLFLKQHVDRYFEGTGLLQIKVPYSKDEIIDRILTVTAETDLKKDGYIRPVITRGGEQLGITAPCPDPVVFAYSCPMEMVGLFGAEDYRKGLSVATMKDAETPHLRIDRAVVELDSLKWLDYSPNTMAKKLAVASGYKDSLMFVRHFEPVPSVDGDEQKYVRREYLSEASAANVFLICEDVIKTPDLKCNCLKGITRGAIEKLAEKQGYKVQEGFLTRADVLQAKEIFETGTAAGVIAITGVDGKTVGTGKEGEVTREIREAYVSEVIPSNLTSVRKLRDVERKKLR